MLHQPETYAEGGGRAVCAEKVHARLCVQRRLACSVGDSPTRGKARALELGEQEEGKPPF